MKKSLHLFYYLFLLIVFSPSIFAQTTIVSPCTGGNSMQDAIDIVVANNTPNQVILIDPFYYTNEAPGGNWGLATLVGNSNLDGLTIDGQGTYVESDAAGLGFFDVSGIDNLTIQNITFDNFNRSAGALELDNVENLILDNVNFVNGSQTAPISISAENGNTSVTFRNCNISGNPINSNSPAETFNSGAMDISGHMSNTTTVVFEDGSIRCNARASNGGAVFMEGAGGSTDRTLTTVTFRRTVIANNFSSAAGVGGGALFASANMTLNVEDCTFYNNRIVTSGSTSGGGGAIGLNDEVNLTVTGSYFLFNRVISNASADGGAIGTTGSGDNNVTIMDCVFALNEAADEGGAVFLRSIQTATVTNSLFVNNMSNDGGALHIEDGASGGGYSFDQITITGTTGSTGIGIEGNAAYSLTNSIIVDNGNNLAGTTPSPNTNNTTSGSVTFTNPTPTNTENPAGFNYDVAGTQGAILGVLEDASSNTDCAAEEVMPPAGAAPCDPLLSCVASAGYVNVPIHEICYDGSGNYVANGTVDATLTHTNEPSPIADFTYVYFVVDDNNIIQQIVTASSAADGTVTSLDLSAYMENTFNVYGLIYQTADGPDLPEVNDAFIFTTDTNYDGSLEDEAATPATFCGDYISATLQNDICVTETTGDTPTVDGSLDAGLYQHIVEYPYTAPLGAPATDANSIANSDFDNESSAFRYYDAGFTLQFISGGRSADIEQFYITYDADNLYITVIGPNAYDINGADEMDLFVAIDTDNNTGSAVTLANTAAPFTKKIDFGGWAPDYFVSVESSTYAELRAASAAAAILTDMDNANPAAGATFETVINGNVTEIRIPWAGGFGVAPNPNTGATWNFAVYTTYTADDYDAYDSAPGTGNASLFEQLGDLPFDGDHCGTATDAVSMMNDASCGFNESDDSTGAGDGTSGREPASDNSDSDFDTIEEFYQINNIGQLNAVCVCCQADAGDIATDMTPTSFTICQGEDLVDAADASVAFVPDYTAADETDPGTANYEYGFLLVNFVNQMVAFEVDNTNRDVDFDFSTLTPGTYTIYGISYLNTNDYNGGGADNLNAFLTFIDGVAENDIQAINDYATGTNFSETNNGSRILCLDITNLNAAGDPVQVVINPTPTATVTSTAEVCTSATEGGIDEGQEDLDVLVTAGDMTGTWTIVSGNGGGTATITGAMATADVVFDAGMEAGSFIVRYTVTIGSCSSTYDVTITRVSCQPPCSIELASINPCGGGSPSDGNNEYVLMNNLSGGDMPITDLVVGVLQDATIDVNDEYDFNYSWNTGGTVPVDHNDTGGAGNTEYSIITTADATTAMLTQQLNDYAGQACMTSPTFVDASGLTDIPDGALFALFLGAYDNTPGFDDPYNSFFDDFSIGGNGSSNYCGQTIYVLYGTGSQSGFASNSSSRAYYVSLNNEASETVVAYNPSGSQPFGMIDCNGTVGSFGMCRAPAIEATKQDQLTDGTPITLPLERGATIQYEVVLTNSGDGIAGMVNFTDDITGQANITLVQASVATANITYSFASPPTPMIDATNLGNGIVDIDLGDIPAGEMVTIVFQVTIDNPTTPAAIMSVQNQGTVGGDNFPDEPTDDPDTVADDDPTITPICIADAGDIITDMTPTSFTICQGDDLVDAADASVSFQIDYTAADEIDPGITNYEYAFLVVNNATNQIASFEVDNTNRDVDVDFSTLPVGTYDIYAISYLNTNNYNGGAADDLNTFLTFIDGTADNDIQEINDFNNGTNNGGTNTDLFNLCLDITNLNAAASPVQVIINPLPDAAASSNTPICSAETANINVTNPNAVGGTFNWTATYNGATGGAGSATGVAYGTSAISETLMNTSSFPITVTYTITPVGPNPANCVGTTIMHNVVIDPLPVAVASSNTPICSGETANVDVDNSNEVGGTFNWTATYNGATGGANSATGVSYGTAAISETLTNATASPITVTYTITPIGPAPTNCAGTAIMQNVVVNPLPDAAASSNTPICSAETANINVTNPNGIGGTFNWTATYNGATGGANSATGVAYGTSAISETLTNATASPITVTYTIMPIGPAPTNCAGTAIMHEVVVNPLPDAAANSNTPICSAERANIDVTNPNGVGGTFNWTATYNGIAGGGGSATSVAYGASAISEMLINSTTSPITVTYTITPIGPAPTSCAGTAIMHDVVVNPLPDATVSGGGTVCQGDALPDVTITLTGTAPWSITYDDGSNLTTINNIMTSPYTISNASAGTYTVEDITDGNNCSNEGTGSATVVVNSLPNAAATSNTPTCSGDRVNIDVSNPNGVGGTFNWTATYNGATGGVGSATGVAYGTAVISESLFNNTNAAVTVTYTITPVGPAPTNCEGAAIMHEVIVGAIPNIMETSNAPICSGETANITVTNPNGVGGTFNWTATYGAVTGGAGSAMNVNYGTNAISEMLTNPTTAPITVIYRLTPVGPNPANCENEASVHEVIVNPIPDAAAVSNSPICSGTSTMVDVTNPNGVGGTFNWTATYGAVTGGAGSAMGVAYGTDAIDETLINTTNAPINVTYIITPIGPATTNCAGMAITHIVVVSPLPDAVASSNTPICSTETANIDVTNPNGVGGTFNWTAAYNGATGGANSATGVAYGTAAISETLTNTSDAPITVTYTITSIGPNPSNCSGTAIMHDVVVNPLPNAMASSSSPICSGGMTLIDVMNPNGVGGTFNWTATYGAVTGGAGSAMSVAYGTDAINETLTNMTNAPITVTYTLTPIGPATTNCEGTAITHDITVSPALILTSGVADCGVSSTQYSVTFTLAGGTGTYNTVVIASGMGTLDMSSGDDNTTFTVSNIPSGTTVTINATDSDGCVIMGAALNTTMCNCLADNGNLDETGFTASTCTVPATVDVGTPPLWTGEMMNGFTQEYILVNDADDLIDEINTTGQFTGLAVGSYTIYAINYEDANPPNGLSVDNMISDINGGCFDIDAALESVNFIVYPTPDAAVSSNTPICSAETANVNVTNPNMVGGTFNWTATYNGATGGAGSATGVAYGMTAISETLTNTSNAPITVTYTITPIGPDPDNCVGTAIMHDVVVNPLPDAAASSNTPICSAEMANIDVTNPNGVGGTFNWTATYNGATGGAGSATGVAYGTAAISEILTNSTAVPITVTYTITPIGPAITNCVGTAIMHEVIVNPLPDAAASSNTPICSAETTNIDVSNPNGVGDTFNWTAIYNGATGGANSATGVSYGTAAISETLTNSTNAPITVTYTITSIGPATTNCAGMAIMHDVVVNPLPNAAASSNTPVCSEMAALVDVSNPNGVGGTFNWTAVYNGVTGGAGLGTNTAYGTGAINETLTNSTNAPITVTYRITPIGPNPTNCMGADITHDVVINPLPDAVATSNTPICSAEIANIEVTNPNMVGGTFSWTAIYNGATGGAGSGMDVTYGTAAISETLTNSTNAPITVTYTITPIGPAPTNCAGMAIMHNVIVNPLPNVMATSAGLFCSGETTNVNVSNPNSIGGTFNWTANYNGATGGANSGTSVAYGTNVISEVLSNTTNANITVTYTITPIGPDPTNCEGAATTHDVIITPDLTLTSGVADCGTSSTQYNVTFTLNGGSGTYTSVAIASGMGMLDMTSGDNTTTFTVSNIPSGTFVTINVVDSDNCMLSDAILNQVVCNCLADNGTLDATGFTTETCTAPATINVGTPPLWTGEATIGFTQQYILVNDADGLIDAISGSGEFTGLAVGTYTIYAINFETANPPTGLLIGNEISDIMGGCFVIDATTESVSFTVHPLPISNDISLQSCADQGTNTFTFNLSDAENPLANTNLGDGDATLGENMDDDIDNGADGAVIVTYHANQADADNSMNAITTEEVTAGTPETLIARVEDATTGCFSTATLSLNVLPLPTTSITSNATVCSGDDAVFGIMGTNGSTLTYNFNGGINMTLALDGTVQMLTFPMATSDVILNLASVSTSGMNSCTNELGTTSTVMVRPNPVTSIVSNDAVCSGDDAVFEVIGTDGSTLTYSFGGGTNTMTLVLNGTNQNISFPMAMSDVTLTLVSIETGGTPNCSTTLGTSAVVEVRITPTATVEPMASVCTEATEMFNDNGQLDLSTLITSGDMSGTWMITSGNTNGTATLMGAMFDAGMETGPFNLVYTIAGVAPCSDNTYDVTITREECIIPEIFNENGPTFTDPCFCLDNATTLTDGQFGEEIVIISDPGETWTVVAVNGLFNFNSPAPPAAPIDNLLGITFTENPLVPGEYLLLGKHIDAIGYTISATSPDHQGLTLTISNTCFYPEPAVLNVPTGVNVCSAPFTVEGVELNGLLPENAALMITGPNGFSETVTTAPYEFTFDPTLLELGTYIIEFFFDAGTPTAASQAGLPAAQADPGCTITATETFEMLVDFDGVMVCNDQINVTLNGTTCEALIEPASLIEGEYDPDLFMIVMQAADGTPVSNPIDGSFAGQCVTAMITENCSGNSCWGTICVEDKSAPVCAPAEESEVNISYDINCNGVIDGNEMSVNDPSGVDDLMDEYILCSLAEANGIEIYFDILEPFNVDGNGDGDFNDNGIDALADFTDCTAIDYIFFQDEVTEICELEDLISLPIDDTRYDVNEFEICEVYQRTWFAIDVNGYQSDGCSQYVFTLRPKANRIILEPVVSVDCTEDFPDTAPYFTVGGDANLDNNGTGSEGPMYADDKIYELPSNGHACKYAVSFHEDPEIETCESSFKKLRHWTVVDWCDGSRVYDEFTQLIKVEDNTAPFIGIDENGDGVVDLNASGQPIAPPTSFTINAGYFDCEAAGNIPLYATLDNCSTSTDDIINVTIERITNSPFDEEVYIAEFDNGADVADLDLIFGVYTVTYIAVDDCGNESNFVATMTVEDRKPPVAICNDILNVTLTSFENGDDNILLARVTGEDLDDTSYDNCFEVSYLVRSTANASPLDDDWQEWVELSCDDITNDDLVAELLVFEDRNGDGQFVDELTPNPSFTVGGGVPQFFMTPDGIDDFDGGLSSVCTTVLQVEDLAIPTVVCEDKAIDCDDPDLEAFRDIARVDFCAPSVTGGCDNPLSVDLSVQIIDITYDATCKTGVFVRRWTATRMINGEALTTTCDQYITVNYQSDWTMTFPVDQVFECTADGTETPAPLTIDEILENDGCDQWGMEVEDEVYDIIGQDGNGACYKIVRTYKFINWCTWDPTNTELGIVNRPEGVLSGPAVQLRHRSSNFGRNQFGDEQDGDPYNEIISALDVIAASSPDFDANLDAADDGALVLIDNDFAGGDESQDTDINVFNRQYSERINNNDNVVGVYANNYGYFAYRQIIKVADTQAPIIEPIADIIICDTLATAPDCAAALTICGPSVTDCRNTYQTTYTVSDSAGEIIALGEFVDGATPDDCINLGAFPFGVYIVTYVVEDGCGNFADVTYTITTSDCKAPTAYCTFGLSVDLMPSGMVELWAEDFDAGSFGECSEVTNLSFDEAGLETSMTFTCDNIGTNSIDLFVTDSNGNVAYCSTFVIVQVNPNTDGSSSDNCDGNGFISGRIFTALDEDIADVQVHLSGNMTATTSTGVSGLYDFTSFIPGHDYTIAPEKDIYYLNGVSTFDLVLIKKHILGIQLLDSPYKLIAADANNSQSITTFDLVQLRKLILVIDETLAANTSWRFVDASYEFPDPSNPWLEAFPELINVNDYDGTSMSLDFVGVKIGDVNHSAIPNHLVVPEDRNHEGTFYLKTKDQQLSAGESVQLDFYPSMTNIEGYQFTLNYLTNKVELMEVQEGIATASNFGVFATAGVITSSWEGELDNTENKMFSLVFQAKEDLRISDVLELTSQYTTAEAYVQVSKQSASTVWNVDLAFENNSPTTIGFELYQNHPNPYQTTTAISFHLPQAAFATLTIHDVTGRVVEVIQGDYAKGLNRIPLAADKFQTSVLYYTLETEGFTATKKMILIK